MSTISTTTSGGGGGVTGLTELADATENELVSVHATTTKLQAEENLTFASKKLSLFNEADEIGSAGWVSNVFTIGTEASGGGVLQPNATKGGPFYFGYTAAATFWQGGYGQSYSLNTQPTTTAVHIRSTRTWHEPSETWVQDQNGRLQISNYDGNRGVEFQEDSNKFHISALGASSINLNSNASIRLCGAGKIAMGAGSTNVPPTSICHINSDGTSNDVTDTDTDKGAYRKPVGFNCSHYVMANDGLTATSGHQVWAAFTPNLRQGSSAGYTALRVNAIETAVGTGVDGGKILFDAMVGETTKMNVDNTGTVNIGGTANSGLLMRSTSATPATPTQDVEARIYVKADRLIIQFDDDGQERFKSLDLSGESVTWEQGTSEPT